MTIASQNNNPAPLGIVIPGLEQQNRVIQRAPPAPRPDPRNRDLSPRTLNTLNQTRLNTISDDSSSDESELDFSSDESDFEF